ncbi:phosphonate C-P lyase system protein PhnG [Rhizobium sp. FY34]|uniref:phosphonate C-P lyase system protein PhnG n=1 Tax=Rhizobium sp. FY34 TaxID=2562309 RepID=UPI0010C12B7E|nr:phosphonate C-P lyase system protein PhnG [Rhizobium sp. FY34]
MSAAFAHDSNTHDPRKRVIDLLARCSRDELEAAMVTLEQIPSYLRLRGPETGLVIVKGRIGGGGSPFNLGETTVSRAAIHLEDGRVGHGFRLGTDRRAAELSAVFDALWQAETERSFVEQTLLLPAERKQALETDALARETAATKVDFFTMVRGED